MKKKLLALLLSTAMVLSLVACGGKEEAPATDAPATEDAATDDAAATEDLHFEVIVKSFQSTYWQAAVTGINQACE